MTVPTLTDRPFSGWIPVEQEPFVVPSIVENPHAPGATVQLDRLQLEHTRARAPDEKDSLSAAKAKAEELMRRLTA